MGRTVEYTITSNGDESLVAREEDENMVLIHQDKRRHELRKVIIRLNPEEQVRLYHRLGEKIRGTQPSGNGEILNWL